MFQFRDARALTAAAGSRQVERRAKTYYREADSWFDGTPDSVDRRVASCTQLISATRAALARDPLSSANLRRMSELESDLSALQGVRHDLLTGASDRQERRASAGRGAHRLRSDDARWVTLESAKFARDNSGVSREEVAERARRFASDATSTLRRGHSAAITAAFVDSVLHHEARASRKAAVRTASAQRPHIVQDFDASMLYLG